MANLTIKEIVTKVWEQSKLKFVAKETDKGLSSNDYTDDEKSKLEGLNVACGTCSTAAATAEKAVTLPEGAKWELKRGAIVTVKFSATNTAQNPKLNVNGTGAKDIWYSTALITTSNLNYAGTSNCYLEYVYDGTQYVWMGMSRSATYTNAGLGQCYATCSTDEDITAKVASMSSYTLVTGGIVAVKFTSAVPANATLNVNGKGAKPIFYRGAKIVSGIIKAGDTASFIYDGTNYHVISIDTVLDMSKYSTTEELKSMFADKTVTENSIISIGNAAGEARNTANSLADIVPTLQINVNTLSRNKLDSNVAEQTYAKKSDITNIYKIQGSVNVADLPTEGMEIGWVYDLKDESEYGPAGTNVVWTEDGWDALAGKFEIETMTQAELDELLNS